MQAIVDACKQGRLQASVEVVISNNSGSGALLRARREGVAAVHLSSKTHKDSTALDAEIAAALTDHEVGLVLLAGYMRKLGPEVLEKFRGRILNIHPALLPRFGGPGMYGMRVHEAVLESGEKTTGVSIHVVDAEYDHGPVIARAEVPVVEGDSPESLAERVLAEEHRLYVKTLSKIQSGRLVLPD